MRTNLCILTICGSMMLGGCVQLKQTALYPEAPASDTSAHIYNVYALNIFEDQLSSENWFTTNTSCIQVKQVHEGQFSGSGALQISWNKPQSTCDWIGMGFGWDDWYAKDLHAIMDSASLEFYVRNLRGITNGLPWALALEDYGNAQAWVGMTPNFIENGRVTEEWTKVTVPLNAFDITEQQPDLYTVKQLLIQFEGEGEIMIDQMRLVPGTRSGRKETTIFPQGTVVHTASDTKEIVCGMKTLTTERGTISITFDDKNMYVCAEIQDAHPLQNVHNGEQIWNGDAIELAFSTNPNASRYRKKYLLSDKHIGIRVSDVPEIYDWSRNKAITEHNTQVARTQTGYVVVSSIPWTALDCQPWQLHTDYGLEVGVNDGDASGGRITQTRWNNNYTEGFHTDPSMWGIMHINSVEEIK